MGRRYNRRSSASSIIGDIVFIASRLPWWGALLLGLITGSIFYFFIPLWLELELQKGSSNRFFMPVEAWYSRHINKFQWVGTACGIIGVFFAIRNYFVQRNAGYHERSFVGLLSKILGRNID